MLLTRTDSVMPTLVTSSFGKMAVCMFGNRVKNLKKTIIQILQKTTSGILVKDVDTHCAQSLQE